MSIRERERLRILHLISSSGLLGAERVMLELAEQTRRSGFDVSIGLLKNSQSPNPDLADAARRRGFTVETFACGGRFDRTAIAGIRSCLRSSGINILHSHNYKSNFYSRAGIWGAPVHWVVTNHGRRRGWKLGLYSLLDLLVVRRAEKIAAVSEDIARRLRKSGINQRKISVIQNGITIERFRSLSAPELVRESLCINRDALIVGSVGSLTSEKGHEYLIRAIPKVIGRFPQVRLIIVGDGERRGFLEDLSNELGVRGNVIFTGTRNDIPEILSALDVFVLPSVSEGLPMALLEAQCAGVPSVATCVGAIPDVVVHGVTGYLVPPRDTGALESAISYVLANRDAALVSAQRGLDRVRQKFSSEKMGEEYISLYQEVLSGKAHGKGPFRVPSEA